MNCKHVDILAIAILLLGMALLSTVRYAPFVAVPHKRIVAEPFHRPSVMIPKPPRLTLTFS